MTKKNIPWICTDPIDKQYGRKISNWVFEFKQKGVSIKTIDLEDYSTEEMQCAISTYGYSLNPASSYFIFDIYHTKETVNWIIAECIFEAEFC